MKQHNTNKEQKVQELLIVYKYRINVTDLQAQDPEFKKLLTQQFIDADEIKIVGIFGSTRTTPDGPSFVYAEINDIFDFVQYDRRDMFKFSKQSI